MELFLDSADLSQIMPLVDTGLVQGLTTNPSLIAGQGELRTVMKRLCEVVQGPVSLQVNADDRQAMLDEGMALAEIAENVVVKVPLSPAGLWACSKLADEGIDVNVTLCFSVPQALLAAAAGAAYVSPFMGRLDDVGADGIALLERMRQVYDAQGIETRILAASIRHLDHLEGAALAGADVATLPPAIFWEAFQHPLTTQGIDKFRKDALC